MATEGDNQAALRRHLHTTTTKQTKQSSTNINFLKP